jgi:transcriptional regulator with XRE-family HTH domain
MNKQSQLKHILFAHNISQEEFAKASGINRSYISQALNGRLNLNDDEQQRIAEFLGLNPEEVFENNSQ